MAVVVPWASVLVCGDYLSPVEIPWISDGGGAAAYLETLQRLRPLLERVDTVVPGHGGPQTSTEAVRVLGEDVTYLERLQAQGADAELPAGRNSPAQRKIHRENVERLR
jgi:glyoxylase-like metal-dependent hydrolase (beta-lactamase superfamily II)